MSRFVCEAVEPQHKTCPRCITFLPVTEFYKNPRMTYGIASFCKPCAVISKIASRDRLRSTDRSKYTAQNRKYQLKRLYGFSPVEFNDKWIAQGGQCSVCREPLTVSSRGAYALDHCHTTGRVRDILCGHCNKGLGHFRDRPEYLRRAAAYLEVHQSPQELTSDTAAAGHA